MEYIIISLFIRALSLKLEDLNAIKKWIKDWELILMIGLTNKRWEITRKWKKNNKLIKWQNLKTT